MGGFSTNKKKISHILYRKLSVCILLAMAGGQFGEEKPHPAWLIFQTCYKYIFLVETLRFNYKCPYVCMSDTNYR